MSKDSQPSQNAKVQKGKSLSKETISCESRGLSPTPKKPRIPREEKPIPEDVEKRKTLR